MGNYSKMLVDLVVGVLPLDPSDGTTILNWPDDYGRDTPSAPLWGAPETLARAILDALSSSGRLVPEGSEKDWRVRYPTLSRVSPPIGPMPETLIRQTVEKARAGGLEAIAEWRITTPWTPAEPAQEER